MRFIWGTVGIIIGFLVIKYTFQLVNTFGRIGWAEQHIGSGGTYTLYKIAGIVVIIFSFLYMFGAIGVVVSPLRGVFGAPQP